MTVTLSPERLAGLRRKTDEALARNLTPGDEGVHVVEVDPIEMRAVLDELDRLGRFKRIAEKVARECSEETAGAWLVSRTPDVTPQHAKACGCATCRTEHPKRFAEPGAP